MAKEKEKKTFINFNNLSLSQETLYAVMCCIIIYFRYINRGTYIYLY